LAVESFGTQNRTERINPRKSGDLFKKQKLFKNYRKSKNLKYLYDFLKIKVKKTLEN